MLRRSNRQQQAVTKKLEARFDQNGPKRPPQITTPAAVPVPNPIHLNLSGLSMASPRSFSLNQKQQPAFTRKNTGFELDKLQVDRLI